MLTSIKSCIEDYEYPNALEDLSQRLHDTPRDLFIRQLLAKEDLGMGLTTPQLTGLYIEVRRRLLDTFDDA